MVNHETVIIMYLMYGTLAGMWNLAPGSKSSSVRVTGGHKPWYFSLRKEIRED